MGSCLGGLVHETNAPCITTARMEIHHDRQQCQEAVALDHPCCHQPRPSFSLFSSMKHTSSSCTNPGSASSWLLVVTQGQVAPSPFQRSRRSEGNEDLYDALYPCAMTRRPLPPCIDQASSRLIKRCLS